VPTNSLRSFAVQIIEYMRVLRKFFACFSLSFVFLFASCASLARPELSAEEEAVLYPVASYVPEVFEWEEVCPGISRFDFENSEIPLIYHAVKIDLTLADVVCSRNESTAQFATRTQCAVAVNATPFMRNGQLAGIHKEEGELLSQPVARYGAIAFKLAGNDGDCGYVGRIFASQVDDEIEDFDYAFGGFFVVLRDGLVCTEFIRRGDSRTGVGLSADCKTLYLLVVEGERLDQSRGLSYPQCGEVFKAMGCSDALELDGGSSSELYINGKSVLSYKVHTRQSNSFGFKVK